MATSRIVNVVDDFAHVCLHDARANRRALDIARELAKHPTAQVPALYGGDSGQVEAVNRFLRNERIDPEDLMGAHHAETAKRAAALDTVLVVHDTTSFRFGGGARTDMGVVDPTSSPGFYCHNSMCMTLQGEPLGLLSMQTWNRIAAVKNKQSKDQRRYDPTSEFVRWMDGFETAENAIKKVSDFGRLAPCPQVVHIADREADSMPFAHEAMEDGYTFIVRGKTDRRTQPSHEKCVEYLFDAVAHSPIRSTQPLTVRRRVTKEVDGSPLTESGVVGKRPRKRLVSWVETRETSLDIRALTTRIYPGHDHHAHVPDDGMVISVVHVRERLAPEGVTPVEWYLVTNLPVETEEQILFVVDCYRRRWLIEEYHKALKTGCSYEARQQRTFDNCMRMLALTVPVAVQMLRLRWFDRFSADTDARQILTEDQIAVLRTVRQPKNRKLPDRPTVSEALRVVAQLGGHNRYGGPPGWLVLYRGMSKLCEMARGYRAGWDDAIRQQEKGTAEAK